MEPVSFNKGEAVVIPACVPHYSVRPQWEVEIMRMTLPSATLQNRSQRSDNQEANKFQVLTPATAG